MRHSREPLDRGRIGQVFERECACASIELAQFSRARGTADSAHECRWLLSEQAAQVTGRDEGLQAAARRAVGGDRQRAGTRGFHGQHGFGNRGIRCHR